MAARAKKKTGKRTKPTSAAKRGPSGSIGRNVRIENVRELIRLMVDNDLSELNIDDGDTKIAMRRGLPVAGTAAPIPVPPAGATPSPGGPAPEAEGEQLIEITSPMVGTFYASPSPDIEPYVAVGGRVTPGSVVAIVEAMKVMNEIKADCAGTIVEICVQNAQPVEYGQTLFRARPE